MLRSSVPSRSAVQPSADAVIRSSSSAARARDRLGELARELVRHARVEGGQRLTGEVPLVEEEERRAARLPAAGGGHACSSSSIETSTAVTGRPELAAAPRRRCLHRLRRVRQHRAVAGGELELDARAAVLDLHLERRASAARTRAPSTSSAAATTRAARALPSIRIEPARDPIVWPSCLMPGQRRQALLHLLEVARRVVAAARTRASAGCRAPARASSARRSSSSSSSARTARAIAAGRSSAQTTSFAISES